MSDPETDPEIDPLALERYFAAHREPSDAPDAVAVLRTRTPPRHRARRRQWKPPLAAPELQAVQAQHLQDSKTFVR